MKKELTKGQRKWRRDKRWRAKVQHSQDVTAKPKLDRRTKLWRDRTTKIQPGDPEMERKAALQAVRNMRELLAQRLRAETPIPPSKKPAR